jgi:hypothetical protein
MEEEREQQTLWHEEGCLAERKGALNSLQSSMPFQPLNISIAKFKTSYHKSSYDQQLVSLNLTTSQILRRHLHPSPSMGRLFIFQYCESAVRETAV